MVETPQGRLLPAERGLVKEDRVNTMEVALAPDGLEAVKVKVVALVGERDEAMQLVHEALVLMKVVSVGTSTCTMKVVL